MTEVGDLVVYGAGGFSREVAQLVRDINREQSRWNLLGFLSDDRGTWGANVADGPILGGNEWLADRAGRIAVALGLGSPAVKARVVRALGGLRVAFPQLIHPSVHRSSRFDFGPGAIITAGSIVMTDVRLGAMVTINLGCTLGHDCHVDDFATIAPGANLSGHVRVGEGSDIGTGAAIIQGVSVGAWSVVGAGAAVVRDLPPNCTAVGVPAKVIKQREPGWHERP